MEDVKFGRPFCCYVSSHKRSYSFEEYSSLGKDFINDVCKQFASYAGSREKVTAESLLDRSKSFFQFLVKNEQKSVIVNQLVTQLQTNHAEALRDDWEDALNLFRQHMFSTYGAKSSKANKAIQSVNALMRELSVAGIVPPITALLPTPNWKKNSIAKPSLLESFMESFKKGEEVVSAPLFKDFEFKNELESLFFTNEATLGNANQLIKTFISGEKHILETLRRCAEKELLYWYSYWRHGQKLIGDCKTPYDEIKNAIDIQFNPCQDSSPDDFFPDDSDESFGCLLLFLNNRFMLQSNVSLENDILTAKRFSPIFRRKFNNRIKPRRNSGETALYTLTANFYAHPSSQIAAMTMMLIDTAMNVSSVYQIKHTSLKETDNPKFKSIATWKLRSSGSLIVEELPIRDNHEISSIQAFEMIKEMNAEAFSRYSNVTEVSDRLFFIMPNMLSFSKTKATPKPFNTFNFQPFWKTFLSKHSEFSGTLIYPSSIRVSVLNVINERGGIDAAKLKGKHSSAHTTDSHYINKLPTHLLRTRKMQEFQMCFQAIAIHYIENALSKLHITSNEHEINLSKAIRTGLGVACINPQGGYQRTDSEVSETTLPCSMVGSCIDCKKMIISADIKNITDMIIFRNYLEKHQESMKNQKNERWLDIWYPWLILTTEVLDRVRKGPFSAIYLMAKKEAKNTSRKLPPLW